MPEERSKSVFAPCLAYVLLAYLISWTVGFGLVFLLEVKALSWERLNAYHTLASLGPCLAAILTSRIFYGKKGVKLLFEKLRLSAFYSFFGSDSWLKVLVFSPLLFFGLGLLVYAVVRSEWYDFGKFALEHWASVSAFGAWLLPLVFYAVFEELGWRGFLLPHLQEKYNAWQATLILTFVWACWHIPFFFYRFDFSPAIAVGFFLGIFTGAVVLTSIFNATRGLLLPAIMFHFFNNLCSAFEQELVVAVLGVGFVVLAIAVYRKYGKVHLSFEKRTRNYFLSA